MREIKFRAKVINGNEWKYGGGVQVVGSEVLLLSEVAGHGIVHLVQLESVGQFTGLHDKNGKEIYEGDWLCGEDGLPGNVYFDSDHLAWFVDFGGDFEINPLADLGIEYFEVTGNIYENPELLEDK